MTQEELQFLAFAAVLTPPGIIVFSRMLRRIWKSGGRVSSEGLGLADLFMGFFLVGYFSLMTLATSTAPDSSGTAKILTAKEVILSTVVSLVLLAIVVGFLAVRKISPVEFFGLRRIAVWKSGLIGVLLVAAVFPILSMVTVVVQTMLRGQVKEQEVVTFFREAAGANQQSSVIALFVMAVVVAPIMEETLFRGYFYAVFKGWAGAVPSLVFTATLFAVVHNSLAVFPALMVLAVALTIAYEWSGSILVPIAMHASFNATQLGLLLMSLGQHQSP